MVESIEGFQLALTNSPPLWSAIDVRVLACLVEGQWHNVLTRCRLVSDAGSIFKLRYLPATTSLKCWQEILPIEALPTLLGEAAEGRIQLADSTIHLIRRDRKETRPYDGFWHFGETPHLPVLGTPWVPAKSTPWSALTLSLSGDTLSEILRTVSREQQHLDAEIHALRSPFDGLDGVAEHVIGMRRGRSGEWRTRFEVAAPFEARFDPLGCRLHGSMLEIAVTAGSESCARYIDVGYVGVDGEDLVIAETHEFRTDEWQRDSLVSARARIDVASTTSATILLRVGGRRVDRLVLTDFSRIDRNPHVVAYEAIDPDLTVLRRGLRQESKPNASAFERSVARLFALLGFQITPLMMDSELSEALDAIAMDPYGTDVLAIECTTGALNSGGKLGKLRLRANDLASLLPGHTVRPIVATPQEREKLSSAELQHAARDRIAVLAGEDIGDLLTLVSSAATPSQAVKSIVKMIPELPRSGPFPPGVGGLAWK